MRRPTWLMVLLGVVGCTSEDRPARRERPPCSAQAVSDGKAAYRYVFEVAPVRKDPPFRAIVPKHTIGAKLFLSPPRNMTAAYLAHAARCYARSVRRGGSSDAEDGADPLQAGDAVPSVQVVENSGSLVLIVTGRGRDAGNEIFRRANALLEANRSAAP